MEGAQVPVSLVKDLGGRVGTSAYQVQPGLATEVLPGQWRLVPARTMEQTPEKSTLGPPESSLGIPQSPRLVSEVLAGSHCFWEQLIWEQHCRAGK